MDRPARSTGSAYPCPGIMPPAPRVAQPGARSTRAAPAKLRNRKAGCHAHDLSLSNGEVKNKVELTFDVPPHLTKMLLEYRDRIAPKIIGRRPKRLFVNRDG